MRISIHHHGHTLAETGIGPGTTRIAIRVGLGGWLSFLVLTFDVEVQS